MYKLLIADDEALEREALTFFVKNFSLEIEEIIECVTGTEVVKKVMLEKPDIILLDINMPGLSGLEALEQIQKINYPHRVIFSTAFDYFEYALKALQLGAMDFMVKPVKKEQILAVLTKAIDQLDEEAAKIFKEEKLKETLHLMGNGMVKELITGNLSEEVLLYLEVLGTPFETPGVCFCIRIITEITAEAKKQLAKQINHEFVFLDIPILSGWKNNMLTLLIFASGNEDNLTLYQVIEERLYQIFKQEGRSFVIGTGKPFEDLGQIEQSYRKAREMVGDIEKITGRPEESEKTHTTSDEINKICEFIEKNYSKKLTLGMMASVAGFSKFYINRLFKQYKGTTVMDYLIQIRIQKAKELLKKGDYSVKQISFMVGYSEPNYFTWTFKKLEGISPVKFRYESENTNEI